ASFSGTYDVYIYALAGVAGRGGVYEVNGNQNRSGLGQLANYQFFVSSGIKDPTKNNQGLYSGPDFVSALGDDNTYGGNDFGNYMSFFAVTGSTINITAVSQAMPS